MTDVSFNDCVRFELEEIALARAECISAEATMRLALDRRQYQDAMEAAHQAQVKARQLHTMLAHLETVIAVEIQPKANSQDAA